jgi:hypothetical protein
LTTARKSPEHYALAAGASDHVTRAHPQASKLFEKDHAYAARLVQLATTIRSVVRSTITKSVRDQVASEIQEDDVIAAGTVSATADARKRPMG